MKRIVYDFHRSSIKTSPGLTGRSFLNQMSGCLQPWQWCIDLLKLSTNCFSIMLAIPPSAFISLPSWLLRRSEAADNTHFFWVLNHGVFFLGHPLWVISFSSKAERLTLYSVLKPFSFKHKNVRYFSLQIPQCWNSAWFLPQLDLTGCMSSIQPALEEKGGVQCWCALF